MTDQNLERCPPSSLNGFGYLARLLNIVGNVSHLGDKEVIVPGIPSRPVEAGKYLRRTTGYEPCEVLGENIHTGLIDKL